MLYRFRVDRIVEASDWAEAKAKYFATLSDPNGSSFDTSSKADASLVDEYTHDMGDYRMVSYASAYNELRKMLGRIEL